MKSKTGLFKQCVNFALASYPGFNKNYKYIAEYFGYEFTGSSSTAREVGDFLYTEINNLLADDKGDFFFKTFKNIRTQLIYEEYCLKESINDYYCVIEKIRDASKSKKLLSISENLVKWTYCCELALASRELGHDPNDHRMVDEESNFAKAVKYLNELGFDIKPIDSVVHIETEDFKKIYKYIDHLAFQLGAEGVKHFNNEQMKVFSSKLERTLISRRADMLSSQREASIPYGYLLNLIGKYQSKKCSLRRKSESIWNDLSEISRHVTALFGIEPYSVYEAMGITGDDFIETMQKSILF